MKLQALQKLKFLKLKRRLDLPQWQVVGVLESIWLFTQGNAVEGNIGKHSDEDIAAAIEWKGDPTSLIDTLVDCGWLDRCPTNRLLVHGWEEHAPTYLKGAMSRNGKAFAKHSAKQCALHSQHQDAKHAAKHDAGTVSAPRLGCTVLTKPNLTGAVLTAADAAPTPSSPPADSVTAKHEPLASATEIIARRKNGPHGGNRRDK